MAQFKNGIVISQRKYATDILEEIGLMNAKFVDTPMNPDTKLMEQGSLFSNLTQCDKRLVGKLNYLTTICLDI